jgi:hypothetical protein
MPRKYHALTCQQYRCGMDEHLVSNQVARIIRLPKKLGVEHCLAKTLGRLQVVFINRHTGDARGHKCLSVFGSID